MSYRCNKPTSKGTSYKDFPEREKLDSTKQFEAELDLELANIRITELEGENAKLLNANRLLSATLDEQNEEHCDWRERAAALVRDFNEVAALAYTRPGAVNYDTLLPLRERMAELGIEVER